MPTFDHLERRRAVDGGAGRVCLGRADGHARRRASAPGLYGGSGDTHVCDPQRLVAFLSDDDAKAEAWAEVFGISPDEIGSYVGAQTPVVLTSDTRVIHHGHQDGRADAYQAVLEADTAVMVDGGTSSIGANHAATGGTWVAAQALPTMGGDAGGTIISTSPDGTTTKASGASEGTDGPP